MDGRSINDGLDYSGDAAAGSFFSSDYKRYHECYKFIILNYDPVLIADFQNVCNLRIANECIIHKYWFSCIMYRFPCIC